MILLKNGHVCTSLCSVDTGLYSAAYCFFEVAAAPDQHCLFCRQHMPCQMSAPDQTRQITGPDFRWCLLRRWEMERRHVLCRGRHLFARPRRRCTGGPASRQPGWFPAAGRLLSRSGRLLRAGQETHWTVKCESAANLHQRLVDHAEWIVDGRRRPLCRSDLTGAQTGPALAAGQIKSQERIGHRLHQTRFERWRISTPLTLDIDGLCLLITRYLGTWL